MGARPDSSTDPEDGWNRLDREAFIRAGPRRRALAAPGGARSIAIGTEAAGDAAVVGGIGCWLSSFTLAVTEVTERAELPWLTLSYSDLITGSGFKYIFQSAPTADAQAKVS